MLVRLHPGDWERFRAIRLRSLREDPQAFGSAYAEVSSRPPQSWTQQLRDLPTWVVSQQAQDRGVVRFVPSSEHSPAELISLWVAPESRGQGLARLLIQTVIGAVREQGKERLRLAVKGDNLNALGLYRSLGFFEVGTDGEELVMELVL